MQYLEIGDDNEDTDLSIKNINRCRNYKYLDIVILEEGTSKQHVLHTVPVGEKSEY